MATITLDYFIIPTSVPVARLLARAALADLFQGELDLLGFSLTSYATSIVAGAVRARVILATNAVSDSRFPTNASRTYATRNLYRARLANEIPAAIQAFPPAIT
jgi:hypothetical protein